MASSIIIRELSWSDASGLTESPYNIIKKAPSGTVDTANETYIEGTPKRENSHTSLTCYNEEEWTRDQYGALVPVFETPPPSPSGQGDAICWGWNPFVRHKPADCIVDFLPGCPGGIAGEYCDYTHAHGKDNVPQDYLAKDLFLPADNTPERCELSDTGCSTLSPEYMAPLSPLTTDHSTLSPSVPEIFYTRTLEELSNKALELERCGELTAALDCFCRCIAMCQLNGSSEAMLVKADILHKTGVVYWKTGHYDDALEVLIESLRLYENCLEVDRSRTKFGSNTDAYNEEAEIISAVLNSLGQVCLSRSELVASMGCYQKSLECLKEAYQTDGTNDVPTIQKSSCKISNPSMARTIICIGMVHEARGNKVLALRRYKKGLKAQFDFLGNDHVDIAATFNSMGSVYEQQGQYQLAMDCHKKALGIYMSQLGKDHVDVAVTLNLSGQIYHHFNEFEQGLEAYEEALDIFRHVLGPSHRNIAACMLNVALLHAALHDHQLAIKILKEVLKMQQHCLSDNHADIGVTLESLAISYEAMHKVNKAHKFLVRSLRIRRAALGREHPFVAITLFRIGLFHLETTGEVDEALKRFETCRDVYRSNPIIKEDDARLLQIEENIQAIHMRILSNTRSFDSFEKKSPKQGHNRQRSDIICDFAEALK